MDHAYTHDIISELRFIAKKAVVEPPAIAHLPYSGEKMMFEDRQRL
jgi:hypothetical protein